jgi:hypothetical protein
MKSYYSYALTGWCLGFIFYDIRLYALLRLQRRVTGTVTQIHKSLHLRTRTTLLQHQRIRLVVQLVIRLDIFAVLDCVVDFE